jgi:hypothetical protein
MVDDDGYPPLRAALALLTIELGGRPVGWSSSRRSGGSDRGCLRLTPRCSGCGEKIISLPGLLLITMMILAIVTP